jgi:transposase-like protein
MDSSKTVSFRRRRTSEQRQRLLTSFHHSELTQRDFAARHGIGLSTLGKWLRCEDRTTSPPVKFQEVALPNRQRPLIFLAGEALKVSFVNAAPNPSMT